LAERRDAAVRAVRSAEELALKAGGRLVVFGSLAEGGFDERSDVNVA
jgi:predicted nucleotidyltransferase